MDTFLNSLYDYKKKKQKAQMKNLNDYINREVIISAVSNFKFNYELKAEGAVIQSIKCTSFWGNRHEISGEDKTWEIIKPNVWKNLVEIKEKGSETVLAEIKGGVFKCSNDINLPRGEKVRLVMNMWKSTFELQNELGTTLVSFKSKKWYCSDVIVTIKTKSEALEKYPFIILLAFLMVQQKRQSAAAIA